MRSKFLAPLIVILTFTLTATYPSIVNAQTCRRVPNFLGPEFANLFNDQNEDCSVYPEDSENWRRFIDNAKAICIHKGIFDPQLEGDEDILPPIWSGSGSMSIGAEKTTNFAVSSRDLNDTNKRDQIAKFVPSLTYAERYNDTLLNSRCVADGTTNLAECAQKYEMNIITPNITRPIVNWMLGSTPLQRRLNLKEQLKMARTKKAPKTLRCTSDPEAWRREECANYYSTNRSNGNSIALSEEIMAKVNPSNPLAGYFDLSVSEQQRLLSHEGIKAATETFYLVAVPYKNPDAEFSFFDWLSYLIFPPQTQIARHTQPAVTHSVENAEIEYLLDNTIKKGPEGISAIRQSTENATGGAPGAPALMAKIAAAGECNPNNEKEQYSGPTPETRGGSIGFSWNFNITDVLKSLTEEKYVYNVWRIESGKNTWLAQVSGRDKNSPARTAYTRKYQTSFDQQIAMPQPLDAASSASTDEHREYSATTEPCPVNGEVPCVPCAPASASLCIADTRAVRINYTTNIERTQLNAGQPAHWDVLNGSFMNSLTLKDESRFRSQCLAAEAIRKSPGLANLISVDSSLQTANVCPKGIILPTTQVGEGINCVQGLPFNLDSCDLNDIAAKALAWVGGAGKNWVIECAGDVLARAQAAGINPKFAIWMWIHESGASNYDWWHGMGRTAPLEDWGIHVRSVAPPENFSAQLDAFLRQWPRCGTEDMRTNIASYWFGSCDPNSTQTVELGGVTKTIREWVDGYVGSMNDTWNWVFSSCPGSPSIF